MTRMVRFGLVVAVVLLAACTPAPTATPLPTETPQAIPATSATPVPDPLPTGSPSPGDEAIAAALVDDYEGRLIASDWQGAWELLAPEARDAVGMFDAWAQERAAFFTSVDGQFAAQAPTHDATELRQWVVPDTYPTAPVEPATPDYDRAFLVEVDYPALAGNNAGWEIYLAAPDASGSWYVWPLR